MTVGRMRREMSADEFMRWTVIYGRERQRREMANLKRKGGR